MPQPFNTSLLKGKRGRWVAGVAAVAAVGAVSAPLVWSGLSDQAAAKGSAPSGPAGTGPQADFDNDGHADHVAASEWATVSGKEEAGLLAVTYGSEKPGSGRHQAIDQNTEGVPGKPAEEGFFGKHPTARDFDGDGYTDLAVTAGMKDGPYPSSDKTHVIILWGSPKGLQDATYVEGAPGEEVAAGDFDGDGKADLAAGYGSKGLLKGPFTRDGKPAGTAALPKPKIDTHDGGQTHIEPRLAAVGDLNGDHIDDLVTSGTDDDGESTPGELTWASHYIQGGKDGFAKPAKSHIPGNEGATVGDVDNDGYGDVIVGPRGEKAEHGSVTVVYGSSDGPSSRHTTLTKDSPGVPGESGPLDSNYEALDAGDVDGDGYADVLAGCASDSVGEEADAGTATLLHGGPDGLTGKGAQRFDEESVGSVDKAKASDRFGGAVGLSDMDGDGKSDLAISASYRDDFAGLVSVLPGAEKVPQGKTVTLRPKDFRSSGSDTELGASFPDVFQVESSE